MYESEIRNLRVISVNVNGLHDTHKRRMVFRSLRRMRNTVFFLQETHCKPGTKQLWELQWRSSLVMTDYSSQKGGVAILFSSDLNPQIIHTQLDLEGRFAICHCKINDCELVLVNVYMPTADKESLQRSSLALLDENLSDYQEFNIILGGDFNVVLDPSLDRMSYKEKEIRNKVYHSELSSFLDGHALSDVWRLQFPNKRGYTWSRGSQCSRLDYLFVSNSILNKCTAKRTLSVPYSDHDMVVIMLNASQCKNGKGFWKMNIKILGHTKYVSGMNKLLDDKSTEYEGIDPCLKWELIKFAIGSFTRKFTKQLYDENKKMECDLAARIDSLGRDFDVSGDPSLLGEIQVTKNELYDLQVMYSRESYIHAKCKWAREGDKNTKYFLNLAKKEQDSRSISTLYNDDGHLLSEQADILEYEKMFFQRLYTKTVEADLSYDPFCNCPSPQIEEMDKDILESDFDIEELESALKGMKGGKSPGSDGISVNFYKVFWPKVGQLLLDSFNASFNKGTLMPEQRRGIVTLIPKKGKDLKHISHWRPITVLNNDYKIIAKALASRLSKVLTQIIHPNQTGFISSRYIGTNIRNVQDVIDQILSSAEGGMVVSVDFSSAFDLLDRDFLYRAMQSFNFGNKFINYISTMYNESEICILNRGLSTGWFKTSRGVRQGCPVAPLLFVLAVEKLALRIRSSENISGIYCGPVISKIIQYADDTVLTLKNENSLIAAFEILDEFEKFTSLKVNINKTKALLLGPLLLEGELAASMDWEESIEILGIHFLKSYNYDMYVDLNFGKAMAKMDKVVQSWKRFRPTLKGKVVILNTLILPIIYYVSSMLCVPDFVYKEVDRLIHSFLWNGKSAQVARKTLELTSAEGGLKLHNFRHRVDTSHLCWVKRMFSVSSEGEFWNAFLLDRLGTHSLVETLSQKPAKPWMIGNKFYDKVFKSWHEFYVWDPCTEVAIRRESLWNNKFIKFKEFGDLGSDWRRSGICLVNDLLDNGILMSPAQMVRKYGVRCTPFMMGRCSRLIPREWLALLSNYNIHVSATKVYVYHGNTPTDGMLDFNNMGTKDIYNRLHSSPDYIPSSIVKWRKTYPLEEDLKVTGGDGFCFHSASPGRFSFKIFNFEF